MTPAPQIDPRVIWLFAEAMKLFDAGDFLGALQKCEEVKDIAHGKFDGAYKRAKSAIALLQKAQEEGVMYWVTTFSRSIHHRDCRANEVTNKWYEKRWLTKTKGLEEGYDRCPLCDSKPDLLELIIENLTIRQSG